MKKIVGIITITLLLIMPLLLAIPITVAEPTEALSDAVGGGTGGEFWLDPSIIYTGGVTITGDTTIYGQGAMVDLREESITVKGAYLYIERCVLTNGTDGGTNYFGAIEFYDDASGFVYDNIIVDSNLFGIFIFDSSNIIIKENSIIENGSDGIQFWSSTDITILENIIADSGATKSNIGIIGDNSKLYNEDPNSQHNINIKGNKIVGNSNGIDLYFVNGVSIASNQIYANDGYGIALLYCPIVSITYNKILSNIAGGIYYIGDPAWPVLDEGTPDEVEVTVSLTISNNKIIDNIACGVYIIDTQNLVITYNEIVGNPYSFGIYLVGTGLNYIEPVLIAYNTISGNFYGIYIEYGVSDVKILFNNIVGNYMIGIWVFGGEESEDLLIKGNVVKETMSESAIYIDSFDAPVVIEWNTILNNMWGLWLINCESPQIIHNTIMYSFETPANYLAVCDGARIAYNTISFNSIDNLYISSSNDVIVEYNTIIGSITFGVYVSSCEDMTIQHNVIYDNGDSGIFWEQKTSGLITNNIIGYSGSLSGNLKGITIWGPSAGTITVSDNTIIGNGAGIVCKDIDPIIIKNYIAYNVLGIFLSGAETGSSPLIGGTYDNRNYIIRNFDDGIFIMNDKSNPIIKYNNIFENAGYGVNYPNWSAGDTQDEARYNWWGDISGPGDPAEFGVGPGIGDEISNNFTYSPWLVSIIP